MERRKGKGSSMKMRFRGQKRREYVRGDEKYDNNNSNNNHTNDNK